LTWDEMKKKWKKSFILFMWSKEAVIEKVLVFSPQGF
jgi:hypothetical protein